MKKETVKIKRIDVSDIKMFRKLVELFQEVFVEEDSVPDNKYLREILAEALPKLPKRCIKNTSIVFGSSIFVVGTLISLL